MATKFPAAISFVQRTASAATRSRCSPPTTRTYRDFTFSYRPTHHRAVRISPIGSRDGVNDDGRIGIITRRASKGSFRPTIRSTSVEAMCPARSMVTVTKTSSSSDADEGTNDVVDGGPAAAEIPLSDSSDAGESSSPPAARLGSDSWRPPVRTPTPSTFACTWMRGCSGFNTSSSSSRTRMAASTRIATSSGEDGTIDPEEDVVFVRDGMRVVVDQTSLDLLRGSTIDYISEMIRSSFAVVGNPQSESACGCGSSFAVKNFESNPALD